MKTDCIGFWKMNETSWDGTPDEVKDSSGRGNDGVRLGNATTVAEGKINRCGTFDGANSGISLGTPASLQPALITISVWIKTNNLATWGMIYGSYYQYGAWLALGSTEKIAFYTKTGAGAYDTWLNIHPVVIGEWTHICAVWNGTHKKIYVNGDFIDEKDVTDGDLNWSGTTDLRIGLQQNDYYDFNGLIDAVMVFDKALTEEEVAFLWNEGNGREHLGIPRSLVGGSLASGRKGLV